jgi:ABC-type xylose transport system permease subunit
VQCSGEEGAVGCDFRLRLNTSEHSTVLGTGWAALFLAAFVLPLFAVTLNGDIAPRGHVYFLIRVDVTPPGRSFAHVPGGRAALPEPVGRVGICRYCVKCKAVENVRTIYVRDGARIRAARRLMGSLSWVVIMVELDDLGVRQAIVGSGGRRGVRTTDGVQ